MKIPETPANVGAYYGNEGNGQWQPNGVIIDTGVGGGVVGSGDAGLVTGYVMAGAYYPQPAYGPPAAPDDFADYMWMENEEEFDKQVMQQLEEEALMEQCIEAMLEDEQRERNTPHANGHHFPTTSNGSSSLSLEETVSRSTLNPLAAEFVPTRRPPPPIDEKQEATDTQPVEQRTKEDSEKINSSEVTTDVEQTSTEEPTSDTPEVSAADLTEKRPKEKKDVKKPEIKKVIKQESKVKSKPIIVKSDTKVPAKKKDVKLVKSESKVDEVEDTATSVADFAKPTAQIEESKENAVAGPKPINYAAAARANKPKPKPVSPPLVEKSSLTAQKSDKADKKLPPKDNKLKEKPAPLKTDKVPQRKNSTK